MRDAQESTLVTGGGSPPAGSGGPPSELLLRHPASGDERRVRIGFSVPVLLLGPFALAARRQWLPALGAVLLPVAGQILLAPVANKMLLRQCLRRGYRVVSSGQGQISQAEWHLGMQLPRYSGRKA
ncbi:MAG: hypothetical protein RL456_1713 [Pseudomonadota bacterium]|jgi:hypothetical protein